MGLQGWTVQDIDFKGRKAPYAPVSALEEFFDKIKNVSVPARVDQRFLQKLNIAANNEWSLLSALKFLGVIDQQGVPTPAYRRLLSKDQFEDTLRHLVESAYASVLEMGGLGMSMDDLANYFRVASSPSQAKNAARFFRAVARMAGLEDGRPGTPPPVRPVDSLFSARVVPDREPRHDDEETNAILARARARLLDKLPEPRADWAAAEYEAICDKFLEMLRYLEP